MLFRSAGSATEPEVIVPMSCASPNGCIVLAGDPKQLGPVVVSKKAAEFGLEKSILVRLIEEVDRYKYKPNVGFDERYITRLDTCYRSDPRVMQLCNDLYYDSELKCLNESPALLLEALGVSGPVLFVNVADGREQGDEMQHEEGQFGSLSKRNRREVEVCTELAVWLAKFCYLGIITPYKLQAEKLKLAIMKTGIQAEEDEKRRKRTEEVDERRRKEDERKWAEKYERLHERLKNYREARLDSEEEDEDDYSEPELSDDSERWQESEDEASEGGQIEEPEERCKVETVDGFQGSEREAIVVSLVRTPMGEPTKQLSAGQLKFINDDQRFNVALSRAKWLTIVVGHKETARASRLWSKYLERAQLLEWPDLEQIMKEKGAIQSLSNANGQP